MDPVPLPQWTNRVPKMTQPNLDYIGTCTILLKFNEPA